MADAVSESPYALSELRAGALATMPLVPSVFLFGMVLGILSAQKGIGLDMLLLMSVTVFAGSSQFIAVDLWNSAPSVAALVFAAGMVNARYFLIGASLRPVFAGLPLCQKLLGIHTTADENWALTMARKSGGTAGFLLGGGISLGVFWCVSNAVGHMLGGEVPQPEVWGLDFCFTAIFIALTIGMYHGREDLVPWITAGLAALAAQWLIPGNWYILAGGVAGLLAAAATWREQRV